MLTLWVGFEDELLVVWVRLFILLTRVEIQVSLTPGFPYLQLIGGSLWLLSLADPEAPSLHCSLILVTINNVSFYCSIFTCSHAIPCIPLWICSDVTPTWALCVSQESWSWWLFLEAFVLTFYLGFGFFFRLKVLLLKFNSAGSFFY